MSRSKRFEVRVNLERSALEIVNQSFVSQNTTLAGISLAAISNWRSRLPKSNDNEVIEQIQQVLTDISTEAGLLADNSRAVFAPGGHLDVSIQAQLSNLRRLCNGIDRYHI